MTEPKFHLGQKVAVCAGLVRNPPARIIPETVVETVQWHPKAISTDADTGEELLFEAGWWYGVDDPIPTWNGMRCLYRESELRPLKDNDYTIESEDQEKESAL